MVRQFQQYEEPGEGQAQSKRKSKSDDEQVLLPLGENTLTHNLGIPIVVVVTKVSLRAFARYVGVHVCTNMNKLYMYSLLVACVIYLQIYDNEYVKFL